MVIFGIFADLEKTNKNQDGQNPEPTADDIMEQQAKMLEAKMKAGGVKKKPLIQKQRYKVI